MIWNFVNESIYSFFLVAFSETEEAVGECVYFSLQCLTMFAKVIFVLQLQMAKELRCTTCLIEFNMSERDYWSEDGDDPLVINSKIYRFKKIWHKQKANYSPPGLWQGTLDVCPLSKPLKPKKGLNKI